MNELNKNLEKSLFNDDVPEVAVEWIENGIDDILSNEIIRNVPVLKSVIATIKTVANLREEKLLRHTIAFLSEFRSGNIDPEKLSKYKKKNFSNKKKLNNELNRVLIILDNNMDIEKSIILARLYVAYINELITWNEFCEFTDVTNRLFIEDLRMLRAWYFGDNSLLNTLDDFRVERLYAQGFVVSVSMILDGGPQGFRGRKINPLGIKYCEIIFDERKT